MKYNILTIISYAVVFISFGWIFLFTIRSIKVASNPPIVDVYVCSDYCPEPTQEYVKKTYEGIDEPGKCKEIGGKPYTYNGFNPTTVCLVNNFDYMVFKTSQFLENPFGIKGKLN